MRKILGIVLICILVIGVHLAWFVVQGLFFVVDPPSPDQNQTGLVVRLLLTVYWAILGYVLARVLNGRAERPMLVFLAAPVVLSTVFVMLHLFVGQNELVGAVQTLWFIPVGYFLGGLLEVVVRRGDRAVQA